MTGMRIATWNVNSLKARMDAVERLARARRAGRAADAGDQARRRRCAAHALPACAGYELIHHGEGRWNGVAIAVACGLERPRSSPTSATARSATAGAGAGERQRKRTSTRSTRRAWCRAVVRRHPVRVACTRRTAASSTRRSTTGKLRWFERLRRWLPRRGSTVRPAGPRRRHEHRPAPTSTSGTRARSHGGTHVSAPERAALRRAAGVGPRRWLPVAPTGSRPLHLVGLPRRHLPQEPGHAHRPAARHAARRGARGLGGDRPRGAQGPAHARPTTRRVFIDLDAPGLAVRCGLGAALSRIAARTKPRPAR